MPTRVPPPKPPKPPATCHPAHPTFARGLCSACYFKARREKHAILTGAIQPLQPVLAVGATGPARDLSQAVQIAQAIQLAQDELLLALPEAARALRRIIAKGGDEFSMKAAVAVLRGVSVPGGKAGLKRLLEGPTKPTEGGSPAQVVIGLHIAAGDVQVGRVVGTIGPKGDA